MKISKREKVLTIVLIMIAVFIFWPDNSNVDMVSKSSKLSPKYKRIFTRFNKIHNLQNINKKNKNKMTIEIKRNIFKYSAAPVSEKSKKQMKLEQELLKNQNMEKEKNKEVIEQEKVKQEPTLPVINFKIEGIIRTKFGNAIVISKNPELFVIRENSKFFDKFIFKKVNEESVVLGFIGFENEKIIPIEDRGF